MSHKGLGNDQYTLADWKEIPEDFIRQVVQAEGKRVIAEVLGMSYASFADWFKYRKIDIDIVRNFNYYNSRKKPEDRLPYETELSYQLKGMLDEIRSKRLEKYDEKVAEEEVTCPTCGKTFRKLKSSSQKYCSLECTSKRIRTEDELAKLSESTQGRQAWNKGVPKSAEAKAKFHETIKKVWTPEKKEEQSKIQKEVWSDSDLITKHSQKLMEVYADEGIRAKIAESVHKYNMSITDEQWKERYIKSFQTKSINGTLFSSKGEEEIKAFVESLGFKTSKYMVGKGHNRFEIDIYIEDKKLGIEYNGLYYHAINGINKRTRNYHFNKNSTAYDEGIELIQVWEDQWKNQQEIIKDIIAARLGIIRGKKIYARQCEIREVNTKDYREFCMKNHVQGYRSASIRLGLYHKGVLVQIASFNKARQYSISTANVYDFEWIRGCISSNNKVIGGTSKLLKYFIDVYKPKNILCFSDWNLFSGKGYEMSGFNFEGFTGPDKFYVTINNKLVRINRSPYAYQQYKQMVREGKLFECHGCGSKKFVWYASD